MTPFAHAGAGYLITQGIAYLNPTIGLDKPEMIISSVIGAVIPDIDVLFSKNIKDHRDSPFHYPLFWITILAIGFSLGKIINNQFLINIFIGFGLGIFTHIFFDWFTVREKGLGDLMLFYPFSKKRYALMAEPKSEKDYSNKNVFTKKYLLAYLDNKFLAGVEFLIIFVALFIFIKKNNIL